jgi:hypothetical protein
MHNFKKGVLNMVTRINKDFVLSGEESLDTLIVKANMYGYPFVAKDNKVYMIKSNNNWTILKHYDVTNKVTVFLTRY